MSVIQGETIAGRATRAVMTRNRTPAELYALIVGAVGGASSTQPALRTTGAQGRREWAAT
ncbi:MAG: hypothetical protein M3P50_03035 [Actinomycetota bacterium]|nr:hypothetical protein [Actinomycetota bacterium]